MADHKVLWHHDMDTIVGEIICTADPESGAPCRFYCADSACEQGWLGPAAKDDDGWFHDHDIPHQLILIPCHFREWINDSSVAERYGGPETEVRSGPIDVTWNGDNFEWTYVGDEQEG